MELIRFSHKRLLSNDSADAWNKAASDQSWFEFKLQIQNYADFKPEMPFSEFLKNVAEADEIHARVSPAVRNMIGHFGGNLPGLTDASGENVPIQQFKFTIIDSDFNDASKHRASITFYSAQWLLLMHSAAGFFVTDAEHLEKYQSGEEIPTRLIPIQSGISISHIQKI